MTTFQGFADEKRSFFRKLAKNQTREWFAAHKEEYVEGWQKPMEALLADVRAKIDDDYPYCDLGEPKVFRIHRDTRFAKDKTPYKTYVAGMIMARGRGASAVTEVPAALYLGVGFGGDELTAHGQYAMSPAQLERYRAAVLDEKRGAELGKIVASLEKAGMRVGAAESLKTVPRGVDPEHPRAELLRHKGLAVMGPPAPDALLTSPKLVDHLAKQSRKAAALVSWLVEVTAV
jgi:uncharacterized protein (TIGR02453 family)